MKEVAKFRLEVILVIIFQIVLSDVRGQSFTPKSYFSNEADTDFATGISVADYDRDGDLDVFIVARDGYELTNPKTWNRLYQNQFSDFRDITVISGLSEDQFGGENLTLQEGIKMGASWGDYDNDGYPDLFLTNQGPDQLWHNDGKGKFTNVTDLAGVSGPEDRYSSSALWWDYDHDGDLDLYVSSWAGNNSLYRNDGNTNFTDISDKSGLRNESNTWTSIPFDVNKDGWVDLYMVNDFQTNYMYLNNGDDTFTDATSYYDLHDSGNGMGVDICDFGNDGNFDIYLTNISQLLINPFFVNNGTTFENLSTEFGIDDPKWGWGCRFFDYDHDMDEDLYVVNQEFFGGPLEYNRFYELVNGTFEDKSQEYGLDNTSHSRTQEVFDFNNDGDLDILLGNWGEQSILFDNQNQRGNWIKIKLEGTESNRDAFGAVIRIKTPDGQLQHRLKHGVNYLGQSIKPIHFGLASNETIEELTIYWPNGRVERVTDLKANQSYLYIEGGQEEVQTESFYGTVPEEVYIENEDIASKSIARRWNELLLESIRRDYARPTVHARNLFHASLAMYDAWSAYDDTAKPFFLGNDLGGYTCQFDGVAPVENIKEARDEAISYACYRLLSHRFRNSPGSSVMLEAFDRMMQDVLGYDTNYTSKDYSNGKPAALGNYLADELIKFGLQDGSNEENDYRNKFYETKNEPLVVDNYGNPNLSYPNNWQPLALSLFIDQSGNEIPGNIPEFLSPEWGEVVPFSLSDEDKQIYLRDGYEYQVYHDPGKPDEIITEGVSGLEDPYKWGFAMVSVWSSHLDPKDEVMIDISPGAIGNTKIENFPTTFEEYQSYYKFLEGGDVGEGHNLNPATNEPYDPQVVPRGDYARVLAEFWADGPDSETPPGHWFTILNYVSDHPLLEKKFLGRGAILDDLEWDVKTYFVLGGAMHDVAISAWGIKGYYDYIRPISAIRYMASKGQSSDTSLPNFHPEGIPLIPGFIEVIKEDDVLAGNENEHVGEIKLFAWKGSHFVENPENEFAGVDWILAGDWVPYQRPSFVTPPFAGYVSGHSTFSRAAAEVLTRLTGSNFFPGGMGIFDANKDKFLVFEDGPSQDIVLQWATYQDASDQTSLSRIWGGIHPPVDDIPGRIIGEKIGKRAVDFAIPYFDENLSVDGVLSSDIEKQIEYSLFPVPVKNDMTLSIDFDGVLEMRVINMYGITLDEREVEVRHGSTVISLNNLPSGIYLVIFSDSNRNKLVKGKIIKE